MITLLVSTGPHSIERKIKFVIYLIPVTVMVTNHPLRFRYFPGQSDLSPRSDRPIRAQCCWALSGGVTHISDCVNWDIMKVKFLTRLSRWLGKFSHCSVTNHDNDDDNNDNYRWLRCSRLTTCCHLLRPSVTTPRRLWGNSGETTLLT